MSEPFDLAICGAGPAGTACAIAAARAGWRVALIERANFPRHKVCGDCLNPSVWPVLRELGVEPAVRDLDHAPLTQVRFVRTNGGILELPLPLDAERAVTRESFDHTLLEAACRVGLTLFSGSPLTGLSRRENLWNLTTTATRLTARALVAADGRNSTVCHLLGLAAPVRPGRVGLQCHAALLPAYQNTVALELLPHGYCGVAPVDAARMNVCLVSDARHLAQTKQDIQQRLGLPADQHWHSIAPMDRPPLAPAPVAGCFLAGDVARVVEPFTGEGIFYALRSGQLAAEAAGKWLSGDEEAAGFYRQAHRGLYQNRLWVNRLSRFAVTHRRLGDFLLAAGAHFPGLMRHLTAKVTGAS